MATLPWRFLVVADVPGDSTPKAVSVPDDSWPEAVRCGVRLLLEHAKDRVEIDLLPSTRKDLVRRLREAVHDPEMGGKSSRMYSLVLADYDFTHRDLNDIRELTAMLGALQAPMVANASPGFFDMRSMAMLPKLPDFLERLGDASRAGWRAFQPTDDARWICLTMNRFLLRAPAESEKADEQMPWGRGIWLVGASAARSVGKHGHALDLGGATGGRFDDMPVRDFQVAANERSPLPTEVEFPDMKGQELSRAGFTPITGMKRGRTVVLTMVVNAYRRQAGLLNVYGMLAYQIMAGRLAQFCGLVLGEMPRGDVDYLRKGLTEFLGSLAGDDSVSIEVREEKDQRLAEVKILPKAKLEGKDFGYVFSLPLK